MPQLPKVKNTVIVLFVDEEKHDELKKAIRSVRMDDHFWFQGHYEKADKAIAAIQLNFEEEQ